MMYRIACLVCQAPGAVPDFLMSTQAVTLTGAATQSGAVTLSGVEG